MNTTVGQLSAIEERIAMSDQLARAASGRDAEGQAAEGQGLRAAMRGEVPDQPYSSDSSLQSRFDLGLCDGRTILKVQAFEGYVERRIMWRELVGGLVLAVECWAVAVLLFTY